MKQINFIYRLMLRISYSTRMHYFQTFLGSGQPDFNAQIILFSLYKSPRCSRREDLLGPVRVPHSDELVEETSRWRRLRRVARERAQGQIEPFDAVSSGKGLEHVIKR